jgi:NAD(P)-dependent dehydrogenase (short-subunit alcohol dehydrogenase family)
MDKSAYLVAGGGSGIGQAVVGRLAEQGHSVTVTTRNAEPSPQLHGVRRVEMNAVEEVIPDDQLPPVLQGLVYCPGTIRLRPFARLAEADFQEDFTVNLLGAVKTIQACLPALRKSPEGASIVLFSTVAVQAGMPFHASVASAKGAVEGLTRSLAAELAPKIRVNAVAPSLTDTPLAASLLSSEERRAAAAKRHPMNRIGQPRDAADAATFLLQSESSWITGQVLAVDGGMGTLRLFR